MPDIDINHLRGWIGHEVSDKDILSVRHARLMAATLGHDQDALREGSALPPLWHWLYFLHGRPTIELGRDGHPARGSFLPPVPLTNRMWAGGQVEFRADLPLGTKVTKHSRVESVHHKQGRSGDLVFVSVRHEIRRAGEIAISEVHDIVYKNPTPPTGAHRVAAAARPMGEPVATCTFTPDSTHLFRYSALTFNGHRIHYDADYCRDVEGYENLVIHGPLTATLLADWALRADNRRLEGFVYRAVQPAFMGTTLSLNIGAAGIERTVWATLPDGAASMVATARFE
jgi:3-methylfumaryl-CoA hydratase